MWQYYKACLVHNVQDIKIISPGGRKLMEHSWYGNEDMLRVEKLLTEHRYSVIWLWDYSQCAAFAWGSNLKEEKDRDQDYEEGMLLNRKEGMVYYLLNHTRCEYINMTEQENNPELKDGYGSVIHPLPLLCRADTEEAGGDYHAELNKDLQGIWCGNEIQVVEVPAERAKDIEWLSYEDKTNEYFFKE